MEALSIERWQTIQKSLKIEIVFERGDIIVRQGEEITQIVKEALNQMIVGLRFSRIKDSVKIELAKEPGSLTKGASEQRQIETDKTAPAIPTQEPVKRELIEKRTEGKLPPILSPITVAQSNKGSANSVKSKPSISDNPKAGSSLASVSPHSSNSRVDPFYLWLIALFILLVAGVLVFLHFQKKHPVYMQEEQPLATIQDRKQNLLKALTSQLTQTLFRQRQVLLKSKESATVQVAAMENRLAKLQPEIFDKLQAYEEKIKKLEAQLKHKNASVEVLNRPLVEDDKDVARPIFEELDGSAEGEENLESTEEMLNTVESDKEVVFPGTPAEDESEDEGPSDLLEEVLEDLEAEENVDKRIAKGSKN